ncbi:hypothetical protein WJX77_002196 [Trebouxia sp. C0004]
MLADNGSIHVTRLSLVAAIKAGVTLVTLHVCIKASLCLMAGLQDYRYVLGNHYQLQPAQTNSCLSLFIP